MCAWKIPREKGLTQAATQNSDFHGLCDVEQVCGEMIGQRKPFRPELERQHPLAGKQG